MAAPKISERLREFTQPTGEEELLAVDYPRPRLRISPWQACAVAVILVICVVVWLGINARSEESSGMPEPAAMSPGVAPSDEPSEIIVSVIGEVAEPGLKTLEPGARVADALDAAQPLPGAETLALNHAQRLSDGQQLHILPSGAAPPPAPGEPAPADGNGISESGNSGSGASGVSLNNATAEELTELKGVGEVTAQAIVAYREEHGGFQDIEELLEVTGIGPAKLAQLKDQVQL